MLMGQDNGPLIIARDILAMAKDDLLASRRLLGCAIHGNVQSANIAQVGIVNNKGESRSHARLFRKLL